MTGPSTPGSNFVVVPSVCSQKAQRSAYKLSKVGDPYYALTLVLTKNPFPRELWE